MKTDRMTKVLLALIAIGLLANAANPWLRPRTVSAAQSEVSLEIIAERVQNIDENLEIIALGSCMNANLC